MSDTDQGQNNQPPAPPAPANNESELPQWARDALSRANNESASRRVELRDMTNKHTEALGQVQTLTDEKTAAEKARDTAVAELTKLRIVLEAGVPGDKAVSIAERLRGETEDELKADATSVIEQFGLTNTSQPARDTSQGRGGYANETQASGPEQEFAEMLYGQLGFLRNP